MRGEERRGEDPGIRNGVLSLLTARVAGLIRNHIDTSISVANVGGVSGR
jgi:hypothetical protein